MPATGWLAKHIKDDDFVITLSVQYFCRCQGRGLEMKLVEAEYTLDRSKIMFYFTADGRVDFRELVKDLAGTPTRKPIWRIMPSNTASPITATTRTMVIAAETLNAPDGNDL